LTKVTYIVLLEISVNCRRVNIE